MSSAFGQPARSLTPEAISAASSAALVLARDGVVGRFESPHDLPCHLGFGDPELLETWDMGIRVSAIQQEIFQSLDFRIDSRTCKAWFQDRSSGAEILALNRPAMKEFGVQLSLVNAYADLRLDRSAEILAQVGEITSFIGQPLSLHPQRHRWTLELIFATLGTIIEFERCLKRVMSVRRPFELSSMIQPMITTPANSAFPSGHTMEAFAMAEILADVVNQRDAHQNGCVDDQRSFRQQMYKQAARVAVNRVVAGVHYPIDNMAGALAGLTLGKWLMALATPHAPTEDEGNVVEITTTSHAFESPYNDQSPDIPQTDFSLSMLLEHFKTAPARTNYYQSNGPIAVSHAPLLFWLVEKAKSEWA